MSWTLASVGTELVSFPSVDDGFSSLTCSGVFSGVVFCKLRVSSYMIMHKQEKLFGFNFELFLG